MAALICNLSSPLGFSKVIVLDWWQCVWERVHMFGFTHAANDWRHVASVPRFGDRMAARGWNRPFHHPACPDLYIWKRAFWHIYSETLPFSTLCVLCSVGRGGGHACSPSCTLFWRLSSSMVVLHELELGRIRRKDTAAFTHEDPNDQLLSLDTSVKRALRQMRRPWTCRDAWAFFFFFF